MSTIEPRSPVERELEALRVIVTALEELDPEAQQRALRYLVDRFKKNSSRSSARSAAAEDE